MRRIAVVFWCWALISGLTSSGLHAQEDEECHPEYDAKTLKLIERASDKKKYNSNKRQGYLLEALEREEACPVCRLQLGRSAFLEAKRRGGSFAPARDYLRPLASNCPDYAAEVHYLLGAMAYGDGYFDEARGAFDLFLNWEDEAARTYTRRDETRRAEVLEILPWIEFHDNFYRHADGPQPRVIRATSSPDDEYLPSISADGTLLFFTRKGLHKAKGDIVGKWVEAFSWAHRPEGAEFDAGVPLEYPFNQGHGAAYGGASISINNRELFFAMKTPTPGHPDNIDLYVTNYELLDEVDGERFYMWNDPKPLSALNTPDGWESQPSISPDGQDLYFAAVRPGTTPSPESHPSIDILVSRRTDDGWSVPTGLPSRINTPYADKAPFLHPDGHTLYFASTRQPSGGGYDLYLCRKDSTGRWGEALNLGAPFNTEGDEHGLVVGADGTTAFFASRRQGTRGIDLMTCPLPERYRARASVVVKGEVTRDEGLAGREIAIELRYAQSREVQAIEIERDGSFAAVVDLSRYEDVVLTTVAEGAVFSAALLVDRDAPEPDWVEANVELHSVQADEPFEIQDINFPTASAQISRASQTILDLFATYLMDTGFRVQIQGHTDDIGGELENMELSRLRAEAVKAHLHDGGVASGRIEAAGFGESEPRAENTTPAGRAKNRRTTFVILPN